MKKVLAVLIVALTGCLAIAPSEVGTKAKKWRLIGDGLYVMELGPGERCYTYKVVLEEPTMSCVVAK